MTYKGGRRFISVKNTSTLAIAGFAAILISLVLLSSAYIAARKKNYNAHKWLMLFAVSTNLTFLILYIIRWLTEGDTKFGGPSSIFYFVYIPVLIIHILTALISVFFVSKQVWLGLMKTKISADGKIAFIGKFRKIHRYIGKIAIIIWIFSFIGGISIFFMLYLLY